MLRCPKCNGTELYANVAVSGTSSMHLNTGQIDEAPDFVEHNYDEYDFYDVRCFDCNHEWEQKLFIEQIGSQRKENYIPQNPVIIKVGNGRFLR
mgnify:CR=1 FL=1